MDRKSGLGLPSGASQLRSRLAALADEVLALNSRLHLLEQERLDILNNLNSIVYPILTLPLEITTQIFQHFVDQPQIGRIRGQKQGHSPLLLAGICRSWRDIALSVPALWSAAPLDLHISSSGSASASADAIFLLLSRYSPRWRTFGVTLKLPYYFPNSEVQGRVPLLEKLTVSVEADPGDEPAMVTAFRDAPNLREAHLHGASVAWISLPWMQLKELELTDQPLARCLEILRQTPKLEVLTVSALSLRASPAPPLEMAALHTLRLTGYDPDGYLLENITLPALKTLALPSLELGADRFCSFAARSAFSLQALHLQDAQDERSVKCLRALPSLQHLSMAFTANPYDDYNYEFGDLFYLITDNHLTFLPALKSFRIDQCLSHVHGTALAEMLWARRHNLNGAVAKLESFRLSFGNIEEVAYVESSLGRTQLLISEGLDLTIESAPRWPAYYINPDLANGLKLTTKECTGSHS
ncbi:hypothetical protein C8J57DRAFT_1339133 [Mycena rebaudengoi]|nr:hypothetical protein C8J57DRAFT_1339133 [Mycena rebaudengoi]